MRFAHAAFADFDRDDESEMTPWQIAMETPNSDLQVAQRWHRLSQTKRVNEIVAVRGGEWDELMNLLHVTFVLWAQTGDELTLDLTQASPISIQRLNWDHSKIIADRLSLVAEHWSLQRVASHDLTRWWRGCDEFGDPMDAPQSKFVARDFSRHERLEALLFWRSWLRDKLPAEQIEALL